VQRNRVELSGRLIIAGPLRFTPAAIPVLDLSLEHQSDQLEAGLQRTVSLSISCVAIGQVANSLAQLGDGLVLTVRGFLAARRMRGRTLVLHITEFELNEEA